MYDPNTNQRQPLLASEDSSELTSTQLETQYDFNSQQVNFDQPPPYTPSPSTPTYSGSNVTLSSDMPVINCRVCHTLLNVEGKLHLHVVKCHGCGEATPIRPAPPMKKYVRCPCNCLLICKINSHRIVCPRVNCKRVISLESLSHEPQMIADNEQQPLTTSHRIICIYCGFSFHGRLARQSLQRCPHCLKLSYSDFSSKRRRVCGFGLLLTVAVFISAVLSIFTFGHFFSNNVVADVFVGCLYFCTVVLAFFFIFLAKIKVSRRERVSSMQYT